MLAKSRSTYLNIAKLEKQSLRSKVYTVIVDLKQVVGERWLAVYKFYKRSYC